MRRTKKEFITHFDKKFITIEFYNGKRETIATGYGMEDATQHAVKCSMRGGTCFTFPQQYADGINRFISRVESELRGRITLEMFQQSIKAIIQKIDGAE